MLFSGDVFEAIPFGTQPTMILTDDEAEPAKHYQGEIAFGHGLLISPTCDMYDQLAEERRPAHPFRVLVPILPIEEVAAVTDVVDRSIGHIAESVACLFRPALVADEFLAEPPRRIAQMHPEARRQLKIKLARYWSRIDVERDQFPLHERDEDAVRSEDPPPSPYDAIN